MKSEDDIKKYIEQFIMFLATERGLSTNYQLLVRRNLENFADWVTKQKPVSYTHLTLPTKA